MHGEWVSQQSSLAGSRYAYDAVGRLVEVQETPAGEGCTVSAYGYDLEGRRISQETRKPAASGGCASQGGVVQHHSYDEAGRLADEGVAYEALGNVTSLPAADAGGSPLESGYYADGWLASQKQHGISNGYLLDPEGRASRTTTVDEALQATTTVSHYAGPGGSASWTYNETTGHWTRNIAAITGLVATQQQGSEAVIQLSDLQGNVVGTASSSEAAGRPLSMERASTFGEPVSGKPVDKLRWLGTAGVSSELPGGAIAKDGITYVPQLGQALQTTSTAVPSPENNVAAYVSSLGPGANAMVQAASAQETTIYQEATRKAEEARREAEEAANAPQGNTPVPEGEESWEEEDPWGLASFKKTLERAHQLMKDAGNTELIGAVCGVIVDPLCASGGELLAAVLMQSAESLEQCAETGRAGSGHALKWGVCYIHESRIRVEATLPVIGKIYITSFPVSASAELCTRETKRRGAYWDCKGAKGVTGPWYPTE
ncbi:MAG: hypothetical protein ACYCST_19385 [Acidimicrobiales bacterium]